MIYATEVQGTHLIAKCTVDFRGCVADFQIFYMPKGEEELRNSMRSTEHRDTYLYILLHKAATK